MCTLSSASVTKTYLKPGSEYNDVVFKTEEGYGFFFLVDFFENGPMRRIYGYDRYDDNADDNENPYIGAHMLKEFKYCHKFGEIPTKKHRCSWCKYAATIHGKTYKTETGETDYKLFSFTDDDDRRRVDLEYDYYNFCLDNNYEYIRKDEHFLYKYYVIKLNGNRQDFFYKVANNLKLDTKIEIKDDRHPKCICPTGSKYGGCIFCNFDNDGARQNYYNVMRLI